MNDVCVLGSFMKDLVASAERRPLPGETLHGTGFAEFLGGKGVNQAIAAARMGARTAIVGTIGEDRYGEEFLELLAANAVDTSWVVRHPSLGTGVGLPLVLPDGGNSIIIVSRANAAITAPDVEAAREVLTSSKVLSVQLELPVEASHTSLRLASAAGVTTILTPAPVGPVDPTLAGYVDILVPNEVEAAALTGLDCDDESQVPMIARKLAEDWDLRACVVTLGSRGAYVLDRAGGLVGELVQGAGAEFEGLAAGLCGLHVGGDLMVQPGLQPLGERGGGRLPAAVLQVLLGVDRREPGRQRRPGLGKTGEQGRRIARTAHPNAPPACCPA